MLLFDGLHARTGAQAIEGLAREQAVVVDTGHVEVDAITRDVGIIALEQCDDKFNHVGHVVGGVRCFIGHRGPEGRHRRPPLLLVLRHHFRYGGRFGRRASDDLVVDVGDVGDEANLDRNVPRVTEFEVPDLAVHGIKEANHCSKLRQP